MKRKIQFMAMLLIGILLSVNQVWGATSTYTFSSKAWASSVNTGGTACTWKGSSDGNQYNASTSPKGVQILASLNGLTVTSSVSFSNVTSVVVTYSSSSKGVGSIGVKIGSNTALASQSIAKSQTDKTLTFTPVTAQSGTIVITCNCTTNSYGIQSIAVTTSSGSTYTVLFPNIRHRVARLYRAVSPTCRCLIPHVMSFSCGLHPPFPPSLSFT